MTDDVQVGDISSITMMKEGSKESMGSLANTLLNKEGNDNAPCARFLARNEYPRIRDIFIEAFGDDEEFNELFFGKTNADGSYTGLINRDEIVAIEVDGRMVASAQYMIVRAVPKDICAGDTNVSDGVDTLSCRSLKDDNKAEHQAQTNSGAENASDASDCLVKDSNSRSYPVPYILGVCTTPAYRHRGYMDTMLTAIIERLKKEGYPWCFLAPVDTAIYRHLGFDTDWGLTLREQKLLYTDDDGIEIASAKLLNADHIEPVEIHEL